MDYFYLFLSMTFSVFSTLGSRFYNQKNQGVANVTALYSILNSSFAAFCWMILWFTEFSFDLKILPYSVLYGLCYCLFTFGMLGAIRTGSTSLTALIKQVALVSVSFWGFFFWDTKFTFLGIAGILLLIVSLSLCLVTKEEKNTSHNTKKWLFYCSLITIGNAGCSIVQRYQQMALNYQHKNAFMFFALLFATLFFLPSALRENKTNWKRTAKSSWIFPALAGGGSALSNTFTLILIKNDLSPVILYPGISVGGLIITTLLAVFLFREKLRGKQWSGLFLGGVALILLNLES